MVTNDDVPERYKGQEWVLIGDWLARRYSQFVLVFAILWFGYWVIA